MLEKKDRRGGERKSEKREERDGEGERGGRGIQVSALGRRWDGEADGVRHTPHAIIME